jgi:hypothetical protein
LLEGIQFVSIYKSEMGGGWILKIE